MQQNREFWLTTYGLQGEGLTGEVRSQVFTISSDEIRLLVGGSRSPDACVELVVEWNAGDTLTGPRRRIPGLSGTFVVAATSYHPDMQINGNVLTPVMWDVAWLQKRRAVFLIRDWSRSAHVNVDNVQFIERKDENK